MGNKRWHWNTSGKNTFPTPLSDPTSLPGSLHLKDFSLPPHLPSLHFFIPDTSPPLLSPQVTLSPFSEAKRTAWYQGQCLVISLSHSLFLSSFCCSFLLTLFLCSILHQLQSLQGCTCSATEQLLFLWPCCPLLFPPPQCFLPLLNCFYISATNLADEFSYILWWVCYAADWNQLCPAHGSPRTLLRGHPCSLPSPLGYQDLDICIQYICSGLVQSSKNDSVVDSS